MRKQHEQKKIIPSKMDEQLRFQINEAYKTVRTNIMFSLLKDGCKKIVISSSLANEGKSTTAVHIALSLAQMDTKVLLIDADLRKSKIFQFFNLKNSPGLTNYLGRMADLEAILHSTEYKNLTVMCAGVMVPNPSELLASEHMQILLGELEKKFDYIVIDTPPLNVVVDALPLIKVCEGVVLVVRANESTYPELNKTVKNLEMVDAKILGIILNGIAPQSKSGYYYKKYGYENYGTYGY